MKRKSCKRLISIAMAVGMSVTCLAGCGAKAETAAPEASEAETEAQAVSDESAADLVLMNGEIQTMKAEDDVAQAVAVKDGEIIYVGDDAGVEAFVGENTNVIDLEGKYVTPGFIDNHNHGATYQLAQLYEVSFFTVDQTIEAYQQALVDFVEAHPDCKLVKASGLDLNLFPNSAPTAAFIDEVISDRPVVISDVSMHGTLLNSCAMEIAGINKDSVSPDGGCIYFDENGEPTGYMSDVTVEGLESDPYTVEQYKEAFLMFQEEMNGYGITATQTPGACPVPEPDAWKMMDDMAKAGELTVRQSIAPYLPETVDEGVLQDVIAMLDEGQKYVSDFQNITLVKTIIDGVPEGKTAYLSEPYDEGAGMDADYVGPHYVEQDVLNMCVQMLDEAGYQVEIHAMGDGGVHMALNAFEYAQEQNGARDARHKISHVTLISDEDKVRMADLNVVAAMQPMWFYYDPFFSPLEEQMFGTERFKQEYHIRDMVEAGITITGSVDYSVTLDVAPLLGIEVGTTQCSPFPGEQGQEEYMRNPDQTVSAYEALSWYTVNPAKTLFMEDKIGTIEVGKKADMVVLGYNILTCAHEDIAESPVIYTISDGRIVYEG